MSKNVSKVVVKSFSLSLCKKRETYKEDYKKHAEKRISSKNSYFTVKS